MEKKKTEQRYIFPDVMRGVALAGIMYAHFIFWYTGSALPNEVYVKYLDVAGGVTMALFSILVLGKFFAVFSFLFGMSFALQERAAKKSDRSWPATQGRRLFILLLFGLAHHTLWRGDILTIYAIAGPLLLFMSALPRQILLPAGFFFAFNIPGVIYSLSGASEFGLPMEDEARRYYNIITTGSFQALVIDNVAILDEKLLFQFSSGRLSRTFGLFILGTVAARNGIFIEERHTPQIIRWRKRFQWLLLALTVTALLMYMLKVFTFNWSTGRFISDFPLNHLYELFNLVLAGFYMAVVYEWIQKGAAIPIINSFRAVGRMALTTYLMQTAAGLIIFYPFGIGLFDKTNPALNVLLGAAVFGGQMAFSKWWLGRFVTGPVEGVWRGMANVKFQVSNWRAQIKASGNRNRLN